MCGRRKTRARGFDCQHSCVGVRSNKVQRAMRRAHLSQRHHICRRGPRDLHDHFRFQRIPMVANRRVSEPVTGEDSCTSADGFRKSCSRKCRDDNRCTIDRAACPMRQWATVCSTWNRLPRSVPFPVSLHPGMLINHSALPSPCGGITHLRSGSEADLLFDAHLRYSHSIVPGGFNVKS